MDMDPSSGQSQEIQGQPSLENMLVCSKSGQDQRKPRPAPEQALKCPRCDSTNTKFCYYNNYSLTQPRYFCKSCRRYWTKGGTLRNVPVGGGCRKNKRSSSSSTSSTPTSSASSKLRVQDHPHNNNNPLIGTHLPPLSYDSNDLTLAFARLQKQQSSNGHLGFDHHLPITSDFLGNPNSSSANFLDALRSGFLDTTTNTTTTTTQMTNNNHHHLQNLYYGVNGNYSLGEVDQNGEMVMPYGHEDQMINGDGSSGATTQAVTVTTMKQELCNNINGSDYNNYGTTNVREDDQSKVLWGFPWQMNGNNNMGHGHDHHLDSAAGRSSESWINGINGGSTWHGLLNSPLM